MFELKILAIVVLMGTPWTIEIEPTYQLFSNQASCEEAQEWFEKYVENLAATYTLKMGGYAYGLSIHGGCVRVIEI